MLEHLKDLEKVTSELGLSVLSRISLAGTKGKRKVVRLLVMVALYVFAPFPGIV